MKINYKLLLGLLFVGTPVLAQWDGPVFTPQDAQVVFVQDFETDWNSFSSDVVETISQVQYYDRQGLNNGSFRIWENPSEWQRGSYRDTIINLYNGVRITNDRSEFEYFQNETYGIETDNSVNRRDAMSAFGEDGGEKYFRYISDAYYGSSSSYGTHTPEGYTANYRRYLSIPGLYIEDESSYRLSFYVKATPTTPDAPSARLYASLMRGTNNSEKPFSMGCESDPANYKYRNTFELQKDDFTGEWEKVTLMAYYLNDSIAENFFYTDGYWWAEGDYNTWNWRAEENGTGHDLNYIVQPDNFFARLSFSSDFTDFKIDNLSLTKSWIAGCDYYGDKLRVDFGYQTNITEIVSEAKAKTNIPAVEVPWDNYNYVVWCLRHGGNPNNMDDWEEMPIRSVEYHEDGYMYMFTDFFTIFGEEFPFEFDNYDQVLVTFHNPVDNPDLTLKYTGSLFPKALDTAWIKNGKVVPDFYNETATPNPYVFRGVCSLKDMPPVMQQAPFEEGSFGLDGNTRELKFKFSRKVLVDNNMEASERVVAYVGNEVWFPSWSPDEQSLVITRPSKYTSPLAGDTEIRIIQIYGIGTDCGENVIIHYHFGEFSNTISALRIESDWRSEAPTVLTGFNPASTYVHDASSSFRKGSNSSSTKAKTRVYAMAASYPDNCGYQITTQSSSTGAGKTGNVYTIIHFDKAEECIIQFRATGWSYSSKQLPGIPGYLYFYPKPDGELADGNDNGFAILEACQKTEIGTFTPTTFVNKGDIEDKDTGEWPVDVETFNFSFTVPEAGDYVFEWATKNGNKDGVFIGNYSISSSTAGDLSTPYVNRLVNAVAAAQAKLDAVTETKYKGADYNALAQAVAEGQTFMGNSPSQYDNEVAYINASVKALYSRMALVDLFYETESNVEVKLSDLANYSRLNAYQSLEAHLSANANFDCSTHTEAELTAEIELYESEMATLDARLALIEEFNAKITETEALVYANDARTDYEEYEAMVNAYNVAMVYDVIKSSDYELTQEYNALADARRAYVFRYDHYVAKTRQTKELYELASMLGYEFNDEIQYAVAMVEDEDSELVSILREAAILQILRKYCLADDYELDELFGLDVSALIPNYYFYTEAEIGRDLELNSSGVWRLKREENTTAFPNWTITPSSSGNWTISKPMIGDESVFDWEIDGHVFIGGLRSEIQTKGDITTEITGLPVGYYNVGMYAYNRTSDLYYEFRTDVADYSGKVNVDMNNGSKFDYKEIFLDSVMVVGDLVYIINQRSTSSGQFDMREAVLYLCGIHPEYDYYGDMLEQESKLTALLSNYTFNPGGSDTIPSDPLAAARMTLNRAISNAQRILDKAGDYIYAGQDYDRLATSLSQASESMGTYGYEYEFYNMADMLNSYASIMSDRINCVDYFQSCLGSASNAVSEYSSYSYLTEYSELNTLYRKVSRMSCSGMTADELYSWAYNLNDALNSLYNGIYTAENGVHRIYLGSGMSCKAGSELVIPIKMQNTRPMTAFSFKVELPSGMSLISAELNGNRMNGHKLSYSETSNWWGGCVISLACISYQNNTIRGNDGDIVYLTVSVDQTMSGSYSIGVYDIVLTESPVKELNPDSYWAYVDVQEYMLPGDVNMDGKITITDAVGVVAFIIKADVTGLDYGAADAKGDGYVDVSDAVWIVNRVIGIQYAMPRDGRREISSTLRVGDVGDEAGKSLPLCIYGVQDEITAVQFNITLPAGVSIKSINTDNNHVILSNLQDDGTYAIVCMSMTNSTFSGGGDAALKLELSYDRSFTGGKVKLEGTRIVTPDGRTKNMATVLFPLRAGDETGIYGIGADGQSEMYDLQGRPINNANGIYIRDGKKLIDVK